MKISLLKRQEAEYQAVLEQKYQEARIEGKKKEKLENAKNLLLAGVNKDIIAKALSLSMEELEGIKI